MAWLLGGSAWRRVVRPAASLLSTSSRPHTTKEGCLGAFTALPSCYTADAPPLVALSMRAFHGSAAPGVEYQRVLVKRKKVKGGKAGISRDFVPYFAKAIVDPRKTPKEQGLQMMEYLNRVQMQERATAIKLPYFRAGWVVQVYCKESMKPGASDTSFAGLVLRVNRKGMGTTVKVRAMVGRVEVENSFKLFSPLVSKVEVVARYNLHSGNPVILQRRELRQVVRNNQAIMKLFNPDNLELMREAEAEYQKDLREKREAEKEAKAAAETAAPESADPALPK